MSGYVASGAVISACKNYRYRLWREWRLGDSKLWDMWTEDDGSPVLDGSGKQLGEPLSCLFVMLNPSTADGDQDDPTIRRCVGFAKAWGYDRMEVVNLFAWRATDPRDMLGLTGKGDPIGQENREHVVSAVLRAGVVVCAWGAHGGHIGHDETVLGWIADGVEIAATDYEGNPGRIIPVTALRVTKGGFPAHPLYLPAVLKPQPYRGRPRMTTSPEQRERAREVLEPCPFCGKGDAFVEQSTFASSYVICNDCSSRGPDTTQDSDEEDEPGRDGAIVAWNTRATEQFAENAKSPATPITPPGCKRWLADAVELIRECRLADNALAKEKVGADLRWDKAFDQLCRFEKTAGALLAAPAPSQSSSGVSEAGEVCDVCWGSGRNRNSQLWPEHAACRLCNGSGRLATPDTAAAYAYDALYTALGIDWRASKIVRLPRNADPQP